MMEGAVNIREFMDHLEQKDLVIAPRKLVEMNLEELKVEHLKKKALAKKALTFKEIADAQLWGKISTKAVKEYAKKHAKPLEIFETKKGEMRQYKMITFAVKRIAKSRNGTEL